MIGICQFPALPWKTRPQFFALFRGAGICGNHFHQGLLVFVVVVVCVVDDNVLKTFNIFKQRLERSYHSVVVSCRKTSPWYTKPSWM